MLKQGVFGADMKIELLNDGPVTIVLDSKEFIWMIIYGNELAASFKQKMKAEIEIFKKGK